RGWQQGVITLERTSAARRQRMDEVTTEITQRLFQRLDIEALLGETVSLIRDEFEEIYHAQIFLADEKGEQAILRASTGPVGEELIRRGHRLAIGGQSVIGQATAQGQPVLASDTRADSVHRRNELLPETRSELALPLISGMQIIGALDVQSLQRGVFSSENVSALQTLANMIAIAIDNARLFTEQQAIIAENVQLTQHAQQQVQEIELLNRQLTGQVWDRFLSGQELVPALTIDFASGAMTPNAEWTPSLVQAVQAGQEVEQTDGAGHVVSVPLLVRGQVIGAMEFELEAAASTDEDYVVLVREIADRLALSLENTRLFQSAQRLAHRESVINSIGASLQTAIGVENTLRSAAAGLQTALGAPRVAVRLGKPPATTNGQQEADA
ncbi:MAG: GAF domain-containing protein, partial [Anaerolineae bacterium]|nr:GAF domain-containing protein [Anaerolineae bacterium]